MEELLTSAEVARIMKLHKRTVQLLINNNQLGSVRFNGTVRIPQSELDKFIATNARIAK